MPAPLPPENPFPGMDPWMERRWAKYHTRFVAEAEARLQPQLPPDLRADGEARTFVTAGGVERRRSGPDGAVLERLAPTTGGAAKILDRAAAARPQLISIEPVEERQPYLQIVDIDGEKVVTVIEFLSPSNKAPGTGRRAYLRKQRECVAAGVNLVEIDLTRGGRRPMVGPPPHADAQAYAINVWRASRPGLAEFYPAGLREPLPSVLIPLRPSDEDVLLEVQAIVDAAYVIGAADKTNHTLPLDPPLAAADAAWAASVLGLAGA